MSALLLLLLALALAGVLGWRFGDWLADRVERSEEGR